MPRLSDLLAPLLPLDPPIQALALDSRHVTAGALFAALPGDKVDGRRFIPAAIAKGAVAVLAPTGTTLDDPSIALLTDDHPRRKLAEIAARFYGPVPETVVAVTGTNGKTSVVNFVRQIWAKLGVSGASLGTLGLVTPHHYEKGSLTTPDVLTLQRILAEIARDGVTHVALEASSHGLDQDRLAALRPVAAAFTNLTRDHLDYHGDMEHYFAAKSRLFCDLLPSSGTAVIYADDPAGPSLMALARRRGQRVLDYGRQAEAIRLISATPTAHGQDLVLSVLGQESRLHLPLAGGFQAMNALCALGLVIGAGGSTDAALATLTSLEGIPGRLQKVAHKLNGAGIYIDYAHTPDALETVLTALRPHALGRLVVVFGCGGDRDSGKRPIMGESAARLADRVIITDDNPRTEDPAAIRAAIAAACPAGLVIADRRRAIFRAVLDLEAGDVLVVAGKGHETGQIVGDHVLPFDDAAECRRAVEETL